ncbi:MAG: histidine kinase [Anaerosolibacter sp.]|uniref:sensor histidine kinase n=1 Tax=Anaerosolibacter sp. TaxID=1872527 RepID=UPI00263096BE|nr:HAMP domain-containing sensor histidine kinase [Anaerosolibacter sp.]MDF2547667.1 histidine kinase [Anaerosolibacter sp.]
MDTKLKNYSHSVATKIIVFIMVILCFTGAITQFVNVVVLNDGDFDTVFQEDYFLSRAYIRETEKVLSDLKRLISEYKNEEHILSGGSITEEELRGEEDNLFLDFQSNSRSYNPELSQEANYEKFKEIYADKITQARDRMIKNDLREYHLLLQRVEEYKDLLYYISDGETVFTNSTKTEKEHFITYPSYMVFEEYTQEIYPEEIKKNERYYWITPSIDQLDQESDVAYIAFTEAFLNPKIKEWKEDKIVATKGLYRLAGFLLGLILSFIYLVLVIGRESFKDKEVHLNTIDRLYNDVNLGLCLGLIGLWIGLVDEIGTQNIQKWIIPITIPIATLGLLFVLSLVKHFKNRTVLKHTLVYRFFYNIFKFIKDVYDSGSVGVKLVLIVIGYPLLIALTFFMFPVTIGIAGWFALKRIKAFNAIKEGVERIKAGDIHHTIDVEGNGEFGRLAANINSIADGLKNAVDNELKSERLKTELITNVSHDIRTPLTSIITYVDLLKQETDPSKVEEYIEVLDQKSQRLKTLTDDLFEAAKASSGSIPVNFERIDIVSLMTQGLGELNDKIEDLALDFRMNYPKEKVYITADGKLLWRAIENLLSNIFKYALSGSRVYIDIEDLGSEIVLSIKNISAYELNISADELMERFKRGDESRSSQGSGLGLSIAKSLIDMQKGKFYIQVDGDLFKTMIYMPKNK